MHVIPQPTEFAAAGKPGGFVRIDPRHKQRFSLDEGAPFYPLDHDVAWDRDVPGLIRKLGTAGVNWSRIWMSHDALQTVSTRLCRNSGWKGVVTGDTTPTPGHGWRSVWPRRTVIA